MATNKAVIFDYDGVLVDSDPFSRYVMGKTLLAKGLNLDEEGYRKYFAGRTLRDGLNLFLDNLGRLDEIEEFITLKKSYDPEYAEHIEAYDDAILLIDKIKEKYRLAIATGSRRSIVDVALKKLGWEELFEVIVCSEDYKNGKPDPEVYLKSLEKLNVAPEEAVVIEDAPWGIEAAHGAGIKCIAVAHTHSRLELKEADFIVSSLTDVSL